MRSLTPDLEPMAKASITTGAVGVAVFAHCRSSACAMVVRAFVPADGIPEDPVTRADSIIRSDPASAGQVIDIAKIFTHQARRHMVRNVRGLEHNEDQAIEALASSVIEAGRYRWDVL